MGVVAMSNSKQGGKAAVPPGRLTMDEYKHLGNLLQKAKEENRLGEVFVFANIEQAAMEQLQSYQSPVVMPKAKAKTGGYGMSFGELGSWIFDDRPLRSVGFLRKMKMQNGPMLEWLTAKVWQESLQSSRRWHMRVMAR